MGDWKRRGRRTYDVTVYCLWSIVPGEPPVVPDRIRMKVRLDKGGQHWTATPFYYEVWTGTEYTSFTGSDLSYQRAETQMLRGFLVDRRSIDSFPSYLSPLKYTYFVDKDTNWENSHPVTWSL